MPTVYDFSDTPAARLDTSKPKVPPISTYAGKAMKVLSASIRTRKNREGKDETYAQVRFLLRGDTEARLAYPSGQVLIPQLRAIVEAGTLPFVAVLDWEGAYQGARLRFWGVAEWQDRHGRSREDNAEPERVEEETRQDGAELQGLSGGGTPGN